MGLSTQVVSAGAQILRLYVIPAALDCVASNYVSAGRLRVPPPRCIPTTQSASSSKGLFVGAHHLPKFWGKISKATTKVTLRSHQLILHVIIASYFLTFIKSLVLSICRIGGVSFRGVSVLGGFMSRVSSVPDVLCPGDLCSTVLCPGGLCSGVSLSRGSPSGRL